MTLNLFNQLGLTGFDYSYVFIGFAGSILILLIIIIIQMFQIKNLKIKYNKFMGGKDVKSLEDILEKIVKDNQNIIEISNEHKRDIRSLSKEMENSFNKVGIIKYDAFKQMGGMLSFSIALLNKNNSGLILNSVHSTEGCYTYVKEIIAGVCELDLSNEEKEALSQAMKN